MKIQDVTSDSWEFIQDRIEPQEQGVYIYYRGVPYPCRAYYDRKNDLNHNLRALEALGVVKKLLYSLTFLSAVVLPKTLSVKKWNQFFKNIYKTCWWQLNPYYVKDNEWSIPVWEIGRFVRIFLATLGFDEEVSSGYTLVVMCFLEYDNAYKYRVQDIFIYIVQGVKKMLEVYLEREGMQGAHDRITKVGKLLQYLLYIPKIKKAFTQALGSVDLEKIKFDYNDRFHFAFWKGYNFEGKTFEERFAPYQEIYKNAPFKKRVKPEEITNFLTGL